MLSLENTGEILFLSLGPFRQVDHKQGSRSPARLFWCNLTKTFDCVFTDLLQCLARFKGLQSVRP